MSCNRREAQYLPDLFNRLPQRNGSALRPSRMYTRVRLTNGKMTCTASQISPSF